MAKSMNPTVLDIALDLRRYMQTIEDRRYCNLKGDPIREDMAWKAMKVTIERLEWEGRK